MTTSHTTVPKALDTPLELDTEGTWDSKDIYHLVTGLVLPRPIGWISSTSKDGINNLAPYSYFNLVGHNPPYVVYSTTGNTKDSYTNVKESKEFVVNLVTMDVVEKMNFTSTDFPQEEDEFEWANLTAENAHKVNAPRVKEAKAHLECVVEKIVPLGACNLVIGRVVHIHIDPSIWENGRVNAKKMNPVCRLGGSEYGILADTFKLNRPTWEEDIKGSHGTEKMPRLNK